MLHNLHKQQAPGSIIKNPTSARERFRFECGKSGVRVRFMLEKPYFAEEHQFYFPSPRGSISRGPPCRQVVDEKEGKSTPETLPVVSSSTNPSVYVKCLFICFANDYYWMHFHSGWDQQKFANILHALDNEIQYEWVRNVAYWNQ